MTAAITGIDLIVADAARATAFYIALGFTSDDKDLRFGSVRLRLIPAAGAAPCPVPAAANDPWFQHFAIAVGDMAAAYPTLLDLGHTPISHGGPQLPPPNTGAVTAYKFRDPDGHPLELSYIRPGRARPAPRTPRRPHPRARRAGPSHRATSPRRAPGCGSTGRRLPSMIPTATRSSQDPDPC